MPKRKQREQPRIGKPKLRVVGLDSLKVLLGVHKKKPSEFTPTELQYFRDLHKIIDDIFTEAANSFQWTWAQLSAHAGLSPQTVSSLGERITRYPRFMTVYKLAQAVGWDLIAKESKKKASTPALKIAAG